MERMHALAIYGTKRATCPRISPEGNVAVWTFAYAVPLCSAFTSARNSPAVTPCAIGPRTSSEEMMPTTLPGEDGHEGTPAGEPAMFEHRNTMTPPLV